VSACEAPASGGLSSERSNAESEPTEAPPSSRGAPANEGSAPISNAPSGTPFKTPTERITISDASQVWSTAAAYRGDPPGARAKDKHPSDVTGKDCLSCHDGSNAAPSFAFGGTIASGTTWEWAPWGWPTYGQASGVYGAWGSYSSAGSGSSGGWQTGTKGWPRERSQPSPRTEVRIIGADGLVFETTTDEDGNYWYKTRWR
jgi:hypothetical protein